MSEAFTPRERKSVVGGDPDVEHRRLGASGLKVSQLGLGGNTFGRAVDAAETAGIVAAALDLGVNFYDTADVYSQGVSETYLGAALAGKRDQAVIATKVHGPMGSGPNERGSSRAHIIAGVDASLDRLHTDYIDLLQLHAWDAETPLEETLRALDDLVRAGKIRYVGCSNFSAWQMVWGLWLADRRGWAPFVTNQSRYSLLSREVERELLPACRAFGVGLIPYFPLAAGILTGKYREGEPAPEGTRGYNNERFFRVFGTPRNFAIVRKLEDWARKREHTLTDVAIAWLLAQPAVSSVITGVTRPEQVETNVAAAAWTMTAEDVAEVTALTEP